MRVVQIAELKNQLSAYLRKVKKGEEIVINDRKTPIAKIVPLASFDLTSEEKELIAEGILIPPTKPWDPDKFFAIGADLKVPNLRAAIQKAFEEERKEYEFDVRLLGRKRTRARVRPRSNRPKRS